MFWVYKYNIMNVALNIKRNLYFEKVHIVIVQIHFSEKYNIFNVFSSCL